jgi:hypothetical protein
MHAFQVHEGSAGGDFQIPRKMVKALDEFRFCRLGKHFYGTKRL